MIESFRKYQVRSAWKRIERHFQPIQTVSLDAKQATRMIEEQLRPFFATLWSKDNLQFELPKDYRYFLSFSGTGWRCEKNLGFYFHRPQVVIDHTKSGYTLSEDDDLPSGQNIWIEVAQWSDKHGVFLCCDPLDPNFGSIIDCHDGHPWFSPEACSPIAQDLLSYLRRLNF